MHLRSPRIPEQPDDLGAGRAANNAVVDHDNALAGDGLPDDIELDAHGIFPHGLLRLNKAPADILVLDKTDPVGDPALLRIAKRGIESGIRNADHHICPDRMIPCKEPPRADAGMMHRDSADHRIRPCKVDVFKNAEARGLASAVRPDGLESLIADNDDLPGINVPQECRARCIERTAFRGNDVRAVRRSADAQRPESVRVAECDELLRRHHNAGISAA